MNEQNLAALKIFAELNHKRLTSLSELPNEDKKQYEQTSDALLKILNGGLLKDDDDYTLMIKIMTGGMDFIV